MVDTTPAEATCVNCGKPITFIAAPPGVDAAWSYWFHPAAQRTWCYNPDDPELPLDVRDLKAEPRQ